MRKLSTYNHKTCSTAQCMQETRIDVSKNSDDQHLHVTVKRVDETCIFAVAARRAPLRNAAANRARRRATTRLPKRCRVTAAVLDKASCHK